jgi:hypothetical protein
MYRSCIYCSADLGANEALERFPVGRSLAFDGARGRLWAVCPRCARWNLAPIEERWEAIEQGERLFRDSPLRAQSENVGLARLRDGTRLVRIGRALPGELAVWRYGESLMRRRMRHLAVSGIGVAAAAGVFVAGIATAGLGLGAAQVVLRGGEYVRDRVAGRRILARLSAAETGDGQPAVIRLAAAREARLDRADDGLPCLRLPTVRETGEYQVRGGFVRLEPVDLVLHGEPARRVLARAMVGINAAGARRDWLRWAVESLGRAESPAAYVLRRAAEGAPLGTLAHTPPQNLALEMALHEEQERRALDGELAGLEEMWRQAEEIAARRPPAGRSAPRRPRLIRGRNPPR